MLLISTKSKLFSALNEGIQDVLYIVQRMSPLTVTFKFPLFAKKKVKHTPTYIYAVQ